MNSPADIRSPLLDWMAAMRGGWVKTLALVVIGGVVFFLLSMRNPPPVFESEIVFSAEALIETRDASFRNRAVFERVGRSRQVIVPVLAKLADELGYDLAAGMGLSSVPDNPGDAEARDARAWDAPTIDQIGERCIVFEGRPRDPTIRVRVRGESEAFVRDFAAIWTDEVTARYPKVREEQRQKALEKTHRQIAELDQELASLGGDGDKNAVAEKQDAIRVLRSNEQKLIKFAGLDLPYLTVLDEPSAPYASSARKERTRILTAVGTFCGLLLGLLWITFDMHIALMREMNPARYGAKKD